MENSLVKFRKKVKSKSILIFMLITSASFGQRNTTLDSLPPDHEQQSIYFKHSIGASMFMALNLFKDPADYYLLTYGYRLSKKDRIFAEFNTWKYSEPLGTYGNSEEDYPGFVRAFGVGMGYQRFLWKGMFTTVQATPFLKQYYDANDQKSQKGFQLYLQFVAGYRIELFKKRFYIEPAYALKYWPVDTNLPTDFAEIEEGAPKYIFEPSLNFGYRF